MENTKGFVDKLNENKKKADKNKKTQGSGHPEKKLPGKNDYQQGKLIKQ